LNRFPNTDSGDSHFDAALLAKARQGKDPFSMLSICRIDTAPEFPIRINSQVLPGFVAPTLGTGRTARPLESLAELDHLLKL
jgi:hypothetical protein